MKKTLIILIILAACLLSACSDTAEETDTSEQINISAANNNKTNVSIAPVIVKEDVVLEAQTFNLKLNETQKIKHEKIDYAFTITSSNGQKAILEFVTPAETKSVSFEQGEKIKLYKDFELYVSSLELIQFPTQEVDAQVTIAKFRTDDSIHIISKKDSLKLAQNSLNVLLRDFERDSTSTSLTIELTDLDLAETITEGKDTKVGPFSFSPISIDVGSKILITHVNYDASADLSYKIEKRSRKIFTHTSTVEVTFQKVYVDTTKSEPINIVYMINGKTYDVTLNEKNEVGDIVYTVTDVVTNENAKDEYITLSVAEK